MRTSASKAADSEWKLHREWFGNSAMPDLLDSDFGLAEAHKLYSCHDRLLVSARNRNCETARRSIHRAAQIQ